jgi:hypothetical protein
VDFAIYDMQDREEITQDTHPDDLDAIIQEWTDMMADLLESKISLADLPHEPDACKRSEWACPDCIGARTPESEVSDYDARRLDEFLGLENRVNALSQIIKEHKAAEAGAKEIAAAHGGVVVRGGMKLELRERHQGSGFVDKEATPAEIVEQIVWKQLQVRVLKVSEVE